MTDKIRIKDIAERAGVSVGTVDRVLHERPNVSKSAREKVEKALKEMRNLRERRSHRGESPKYLDNCTVN